MAKLDYKEIVFLEESEDFADSHLWLNNKFKEFFEAIENELQAIEFEDIEIIVVFKGKIKFYDRNYKGMEYEIKPNNLPPDLMSKIEDVLKKAILNYLPQMRS